MKMKTARTTFDIDLLLSLTGLKLWEEMSIRGGSVMPRSVGEIDGRVDLPRHPEHQQHRQECLCTPAAPVAHRWRRGAASEGSQGLSEATPLEKERRPEFVPRQRHGKRSLICICAQVLVPLTRHEFKSRRASRGVASLNPSLPSEAAPRRWGTCHNPALLAQML